jgi:3-methyladenine DNA glycosylase AlkC
MPSPQSPDSATLLSEQFASPPVTTESFSLKDHLFNSEKVAYLSGLLDHSLDGFDRSTFEISIMKQLPDLELKQRIALIAEVLADHLDPDFEKAAAEIRAALPPPLDPTLSDDDFGDFIFAPFGKYVEGYGLAYYETSMGLLHDLTMRFSMEGSIRPFIDRRPEETLSLFHTWARDDHYHVRRLVSESTRPRLPWAPRISLDIEAPIPLLDILHDDSTRYVTRSVANHLNDISKIEPGMVIDCLQSWRKAGRQDTTELSWMEKHALRTLVKSGNPPAMSFLGFSPEPEVDTDLFIQTAEVRPGEILSFSVVMKAKRDEDLIVDYAIDFVKKNGSRSTKVFKLRRLSLTAGESAMLAKRHPLRKNATTYTLYPGTHRLMVMVNGQAMAESAFEVKG